MPAFRGSYLTNDAADLPEMHMCACCTLHAPLRVQSKCSTTNSHVRCRQVFRFLTSPLNKQRARRNAQRVRCNAATSLRPLKSKSAAKTNSFPCCASQRQSPTTPLLSKAPTKESKKEPLVVVGGGEWLSLQRIRSEHAQSRCTRSSARIF